MYRIFSFFCALALMVYSPLSAVYISVYTINTNGGISFTGNTLGLNKAADQNQPGTSGSIGAFITTNTSSKVGNYPFGTTTTWQNNSSSAVLDIPANSTILHAELIWSGSYGFQPTIPLSSVNIPITLITPDNVSHSITPNPATAQSRVQAGTTGFYVRSADVTSLVSNISGTYTVGGVPATVGADENNLNCAGWTLAVAYSNTQMLTSNLTLFVGCEASGAPPALVTGFYAPSVGNIVSLLFSSSLEGDPQLTGDRFLVGDLPVLGYPLHAISGTNNPVNNFFASQINTNLPLSIDPITGKLRNTGSALLDTRGSFGSSNSNATGSAVSGARQGYDITAIDIGYSINNDQTQFYAQGTTNQDVYTVNALGVQIQVLAPLIHAEKSVDQTVVTTGSTVTYTSTFTNMGEATATEVVFTDILPAGMAFVTSSLTVNGTTIPNADIVNGVPIGNLEINESVQIIFQAQVVSSNPPTEYANASMVSYSFIPLNSTAPTVNLSGQTNTVISSAQAITPPVANPDTASVGAGSVLSGLNVLNNDTGTDIFVSAFDSNSTQGGIVIVETDGTYTYNSPTNFSGIDTFNYTITDSIGQTSSTTVTITVTPVAKNDAASVGANTLLTQTTGVLVNDIGSNLSVSTYDTSSGQGGTVNMQPDGTYTYLPALNFSGIDTFNYTITDQVGNTAVGVVTVRVLPQAQNDVGSTPANTMLNGSTVFTNDVGTGLTLVAYDPVSTQGGQVVMNMLDGTYVYTPPNNFSGIDTFTYTVEDENQELTTSTVTITVLPVAVNDTGTTWVNVPLNQTTSVLTNDLGSNLIINSYQSISSQGGTVVMQTDGTYVYIPAAGFSGPDAFTYVARDPNGSLSTGRVTLTVLPVANPNTASTIANQPLAAASVLADDLGTQLAIRDYQTTSTQGGSVLMNLDGTYTYTPALNFSGTDTFTYTLTDFYGNLATATVTVTVLPAIVDESYTINANTSLQGNVLSDDAGTDLTVTPGQQTTVQGGTVTLQSNGNFVYTPPLNFSGIDTFTYTATDSSENTYTATVTITVLPLINNDTYVTNANTPLQGNVLSNDVGTGLMVTAGQQTTTQGGRVTLQSNGTFIYTPPLNFSGIDTFIYTATDSSGNTATATATVIVLPVINNETYTTNANTPLQGNVLSNDVGTGLTVTAGQQTTVRGGTVILQPNGAFVYTPPLNFVGVDSFTYTVTDGAGNVAIGTATINVGAVISPGNFVGTVVKYEFLNKNDYKLTLHWSPSSSSGIVAYRIYDKNGLVAELPASQLTFEICLSSLKCADTYSITAVNAGGAESAPVTIRIRK